MLFPRNGGPERGPQIRSRIHRPSLACSFQIHILHTRLQSKPRSRFDSVNCRVLTTCWRLLPVQRDDRQSPWAFLVRSMLGIATNG